MHGDYRLDNLFFDDVGGVTALDWQITTKGVAGFDFGYFVSQSLSARDRRRYLDEFVGTYQRELAAAGVNYPEPSGPTLPAVAASASPTRSRQRRSTSRNARLRRHSLRETAHRASDAHSLRDGRARTRPLGDHDGHRLAARTPQDRRASSTKQEVRKPSVPVSAGGYGSWRTRCRRERSGSMRKVRQCRSMNHSSPKSSRPVHVLAAARISAVVLPIWGSSPWTARVSTWCNSGWGRRGCRLR